MSTKMRTTFPEFENAQRIARRGEIEAIREHIFCESELVIREYGPLELALECDECKKVIVMWTEKPPARKRRKK